MFELFLRIQPDERNEDPHNRLSKKFPGARIALWCNDHTDILEIESDGLDSFQEMQKELVYYSKEYQSKIIAKTLCQDKFQIVVRTCICGVGQGTSVGSIVRANNFLQMPPPVFFGGWEYHRLVGFEDNDVRGVVTALDKMGKTGSKVRLPTMDTLDSTASSCIRDEFRQASMKCFRLEPVPCSGFGSLSDSFLC